MKTRTMGWMLASGALLCSGYARAEDEKTEEKHEVKTDKQGNVKAQHHSKKMKHGKTTHETKVDSDARAKMGGGSVSTTTTTRETDRPGMGNDSKEKVKETTEKDSAGNVTKHEIEKK